MKTRVHISLPVTNVETSARFYEKLFGQAPTKHKPDYASFRLDHPALHLSLVQSLAPPTEPGTHYGVELFEDPDLTAWRQRVESAQIPMRTEENVTCCYAVADKIWVADPEGNSWEFWVRRAEAEQMSEQTTEQAESCCDPACCS